MVTDSLYAPYIDQKYKEFASGLSPTDALPRLGIRVPVLRELSRKTDAESIEIRYHEDVILKGLAIGREKRPFSEKQKELQDLLPYLASWDHTDIIATGFRYSRAEGHLMEDFFFSLLTDSRVFARRLGIVWILQNRKNLCCEKAIRAISASDDENEYYISMAVAWAFSFFYIDDPANAALMHDASDITRKRASEKIRESRRYGGEAFCL